MELCVLHSQSMSRLELTDIAGTVILFTLSYIHVFINASFWTRAGTLLVAIILARGTSRILSPLTAIAFKWLVIGRYEPGVYPMWSTYHLRWWIVNQGLRVAGRGIFAVHPALLRLYMRLLGAKIGTNVQVSDLARFGEYDLLEIGDNCQIDKALVRGFCVERDGYFRLGRISIGQNAVINTYTQLAPGTVVADGQVFGPHASSHDKPSDASYAKYNRAAVPHPRGFFTWVAIWVFLCLFKFVTYIPWFAAIYIMIRNTVLRVHGLNTLESVIWWFANPERVLWHAVARVMRVVATPLVQIVLGIIFKRLMGLQREGLNADASQWSIIRRYINSQTLSQSALHRAFDILGTHYQMTSWVWRAMGARVGKRVYWPGSGVYCLDPELLEIGDDVVFGSRSELLTTDALGSNKIKVEAGAMVADRVVLLPGTHIGYRTVMGSGSLSTRNGYYPDCSTWVSLSSLPDPSFLN
jgi:acetyltransferase-like isoleucine patch superfamily enzyme